MARVRRLKTPHPAEPGEVSEGLLHPGWSNGLLWVPLGTHGDQDAFVQVQRIALHHLFGNGEEGQGTEDREGGGDPGEALQVQVLGD